LAFPAGIPAGFFCAWIQVPKKRCKNSDQKATTKRPQTGIKKGLFR